MVVTKQNVRDDFAARLAACLQEREDAPKDRGKTAWLARQIQVSGEMARKWLSGEALPNQARIGVIANFFGVRVAWLRDGELPRRTDSGKMDVAAHRASEPSVTAYDVTVTRSGLLFAAEWEKLPPDARLVVEELVGVLVGRSKRSERATVSLTSSRTPAQQPSAPNSPSKREQGRKPS